MTRMVVAALALTLPAPALACGGFFCNRDQPIDQATERIVFAIDEEAGKVEMHVQIGFQGDAEDFAWVVPVPTVPELFLSTEALFSYLDPATAPSFRVSWTRDGCLEYLVDSEVVDSDVASDTADSGGAPTGVQVIATQRVGPYESVTLQGDTSEALLAWLQARDFDLPDALSTSLDPYVAGGSYFVALRLANDKQSGDLAPLGLRYPGDQPVIPVTLTAVAATPDMRLVPWVLSTGRAVPDNYLHVVPNEAAIDWLSSGSNYRDVVTRAADEAGGQAFATDFAGPAAPLQGVIYRSSWDGAAAALAGEDDLGGFMITLQAYGLPGDSLLLDVLTSCITVPPGGDAQDVLNCPGCYDDVVLGFDGAACAAAIDERILEPAMAADALFGNHAWITRLTSSMSPAEMTSDPRFVINDDMPAVERVHSALGTYECEEGQEAWEAVRRLELPAGQVIPLPSQAWMSEHGTTYLEWVGQAAEHAALLIQITGASGPAENVTDNTDAVQAALTALADTEVPVGTPDPTPGTDDPSDPGTTPGDDPITAGCGGCATGSEPSAAWALLTLLAYRRRR